jgi:hypothetical protein
MAQPTQPLPSKESGLFRQLVKFYESKQYKKAIKAADQILKKFPEHGETLAMKVCSSSRLVLPAAAAAALAAAVLRYFAQLPATQADSVQRRSASGRNSSVWCSCI